MLNYKIDSLEGLDENIAGLYEKSGDKFILGVKGMDNGDDLAGLKRQVETLMSEKKDTERKAKDAQEAADDAIREAAKKNGDTEALEASYKEKLASIESGYKDEITALNSAVGVMTIDNVAGTIAGEIAVQGSSDILMPHLKARLATEKRDGKYTTVVLGKDGGPSVQTIDDLKNEFLNNSAFSPVVIGSKASGGGANGQNSAGGASVQTIKRGQFDDMSHAERRTFFKEGGKVEN